MTQGCDRNPIDQIVSLDKALLTSPFKNIICKNEDTEFSKLERLSG